MADKTQKQGTRQGQAGARQSRQGAGAAEGAAWLGGGAAGAAVGSLFGPVGTVAGTLAGGALADEAVENAQGAGQAQAGQDQNADRNHAQKERNR